MGAHSEKAPQNTCMMSLPLKCYDHFFYIYLFIPILFFLCCRNFNSLKDTFRLQVTMSKGNFLFYLPYLFHSLSLSLCVRLCIYLFSRAFVQFSIYILFSAIKPFIIKWYCVMYHTHLQINTMDNGKMSLSVMALTRHTIYENDVRWCVCVCASEWGEFRSVRLKIVTIIFPCLA